MGRTVEVINTSDVPRDLADGRMLAPGERATVEVTGHEQGLLEGGALRVLEQQPQPEPQPELEVQPEPEADAPAEPAPEQQPAAEPVEVAADDQPEPDQPALKTAAARRKKGDA